LRILFIHEVNYLAKPIYEMHEFPEYLASIGHEVGFLHFPEGYKLSDRDSMQYRTRIRGRVLSESQLTLFTPKVVTGGILGRLVEALRNLWKSRVILSEFEPDVVVLYSVPTSGWQMVRQCNKLGIPIMYRAIDASHRIRRSIFSPLVRAAEVYVASRATHVSVHNSAMREYVIELGAKPEHVSIQLPIIRLIEDSRIESNRSDLRDVLGIPQEAKVLVFMGTFFSFSGLKEALEAFSKKSRWNEYLMLIGDGELRRSLEKEASRLGVKGRVVFPGLVPFQRLSAYLQVGDVAINPFRSTLATNVALPNKVLQYMAAKLPVVSTRLKGLGIFDNLGSPGFVTVDSPMETVTSALHLVRSDLNLQAIGNLNYESISALLDPSKALQEFERQLRVMAGGKS